MSLSKTVVLPCDGPGERRPQTEAEVAAHNAAIMAENERERQKRVGKYLPVDYEPVRGRPRVRRQK